MGLQIVRDSQRADSVLDDLWDQIENLQRRLNQLESHEAPLEKIQAAPYLKIANSIAENSFCTFTVPPFEATGFFRYHALFLITNTTAGIISATYRTYFGGVNLIQSARNFTNVANAIHVLELRGVIGNQGVTNLQHIYQKMELLNSGMLANAETATSASTVEWNTAAASTLVSNVFDITLQYGAANANFYAELIGGTIHGPY